MTGTVKTRANRYAAACDTCGQHVPAGAGHLVHADDGWLVRCATTCTREATVDAAALEAMIQAEGARRIAAGETPNYWDVAADVQAQLRTASTKPAPAKPRPAARTTSRKACVTGGNCSSHTGRHCGGYNCDANAN